MDVQDLENVQNFFAALRAAFLRAGRFFYTEKMCRYARDVHPIAVLESRIETESPHGQDESGAGAQARSGF
jgi:hypothetical protein